MKDIAAHIDARATIEGAQHLASQHLPVFDCAFTPEHGKRSIAPSGHLRMMAAVQPFVSGRYLEDREPAQRCERRRRR